MANVNGVPPKAPPSAARPSDDVRETPSTDRLKGPAGAEAGVPFEPIRPRLFLAWDGFSTGVSRFLDVAPEMLGYHVVVHALDEAVSLFKLGGQRSQEMRQWVVEALKQEAEFTSKA